MESKLKTFLNTLYLYNTSTDTGMDMQGLGITNTDLTMRVSVIVAGGCLYAYDIENQKVLYHDKWVDQCYTILDDYFCDQTLHYLWLQTKTTGFHLEDYNTGTIEDLVKYHNVEFHKYDT